MSSLITAVDNIGSSSIKLQVFKAPPRDGELIDLVPPEPFIQASLGRIGEVDESPLKYTVNGEKGEQMVHSRDLDQSVRIVHDIVLDDIEPDIFGHRAVHGLEISGASEITDGLEQRIDDLEVLAPLHNPSNLIGIRAARDTFPDAYQVAVFDTAPFTDLPEVFQRYSLPYELCEEHRIRRYGFHGTNHYNAMLVEARRSRISLDKFKAITCHLGSGCSGAAFSGGEAVNTSMGMTPLEGFMMSTRPGNFDPGIIPYIVKVTGMSYEGVFHMLQKESGLFGISGFSKDCLELEQTALGEHPEYSEDPENIRRATLALDMMAQSVVNYINMYYGQLDKAHAIILTGGIGENPGYVPDQIEARLPSYIRENPGCVVTQVPTNEEGAIAVQALRLYARAH